MPPVTARRRPQPQDDRLGHLVTTSAQGDQLAFARLYDDLGPRVHALATRILRDADYAQEVTQEVFAEIWRTSPSFDPARGSALGWVMTMTHHRAVDRVRHEAASRRRDEAYGRRALPTPFDETSAACASLVESRAVRRALAVLTPSQREAIELVYFQGLSHAQTSRHLQVPLGTIKSRVRDGLLRLRTHLPDLAPEAA